MPAMGKLQKAAVVQTPLVEPPLVNMASSMAPESRKHTPEHTPIHIMKLVGGSTPLPVEDPWHNWHRPEKASGTDVAAVAQWQGQQHLLFPSVPLVMAETHHADLMLLVAPSRWGLC